MKDKKWIFIAATLIVLTLAGMGWFLLSGDRLSQGPAAVIDAMFTYPNPELLDEDSIAHIGLGVETTPEEQQKMEAANEQMKANWQKAVGRYFAPNCLDPFLNNEAYRYLANTFVLDQEISLVQAELEGKGNLYENALVTFDIDGQQAQVRVKFSLDEHGLITRVEIAERS